MRDIRGYVGRFERSFYYNFSIEGEARVQAHRFDLSIWSYLQLLLNE